MKRVPPSPPAVAILLVVIANYMDYLLCYALGSETTISSCPEAPMAFLCVTSPFRSRHPGTV